MSPLTWQTVIAVFQTLDNTSGLRLSHPYFKLKPGPW